MARFLHSIAMAALVCSGTTAAARAQAVAKGPSADPLAAGRHAVDQAEHGDCVKALPILKRSMSTLPDKQLRYRAGFAAARCGMSLNDMAAVADSLYLLRRDFPNDPEVLYASARYLSQLSMRAAQELAERFPNSTQISRLNAEALESKQQWKEAIDAYRKILAQDPKLPGIHFRIASILLDTSSASEPVAEAKKELEAELEINPDNAVAVFALGEIARRAGAWDDAIRHFTRASQLDVGFLEAYLALGISLNASGKYTEAIAPLEKYAKGVPEDPAGHYQLAQAYSRTGNRANAERELQLQRDAAAKSPQRRGERREP